MTNLAPVDAKLARAVAEFFALNFGDTDPGWGAAIARAPHSEARGNVKRRMYARRQDNSGPSSASN